MYRASCCLLSAITRRVARLAFPDRIAWARSTAKFIGATESPSRGVALLTDLGERLVALGDARAHEQIQELFKKHQRQQRLDKQANSPEQASTPTQTDDVGNPSSDSPDQAIIDDAADDDTAQDADWKNQLLHRLHQLPPEGFEKFVIVLTQERTYKKEPQRFPAVFRGIFRKYPALADALLTRWKRYNETRERIFELEAEGKAHVFVPDRMPVDNSTRDLSRLAAAHRMGLSQARRELPAMLDFLEL